MIKFILILAALIMAAPDLNWNGYNDTVHVAVKGTTAKYTKGFPLSAYEDLRVSILINDTTVAGFADDSLAVHWGYQGFTLAKDGSSADTIFEQIQIVDTIVKGALTSVFTLSKLGTDNLTPTITRKLVDTVGFSGYMTQTRTIQPVGNTYFRVYIAGYAAGNKTGDGIKTRVVVTRKLGNNTVTK